MRKQFEVTLDVSSKGIMTEEDVFGAVCEVLAALRVAQDDGHVLQDLHIEINGVKLERDQVRWRRIREE